MSSSPPTRAFLKPCARAMEWETAPMVIAVALVVAAVLWGWRRPRSARLPGRVVLVAYGSFNPLHRQHPGLNLWR